LKLQIEDLFLFANLIRKAPSVHVISNVRMHLEMGKLAFLLNF